VTALQQHVLPDVEAAYGANPLSAFTGTQPNAVQPLSPEQLQLIQSIEGQVEKPTLNAPETSAMGAYQRMIDTQPGQSPATQAAIAALEEQYQRNTLPSLQNQAALSGLGKSGALLDATAAARSGVSAAEVPLLQADIQNQMQGAQGLLGIGQTIEQRPTGRAQTAFDSAEIQRQGDQAVLQQALQNYLRQQDIAGNISGVVTGQSPSTYGTSGFTAQKQSGGSGGGMPIGMNLSLGGGGGMMGSGLFLPWVLPFVSMALSVFANAFA
jgi:hypothetical protein